MIIPSANGTTRGFTPLTECDLSALIAPDALHTGTGYEDRWSPNDEDLQKLFGVLIPVADSGRSQCARVLDRRAPLASRANRAETVWRLMTLPRCRTRCRVSENDRLVLLPARSEGQRRPALHRRVVRYGAPA